jgi:uncharacterized protein YecE (DUF72 family)
MAPAEFEFTIKAWQVITHLGTSRTYRRLRRPFADDEELRQIIAWLPVDETVDAYVMFNSIPRVKDVKRFRELLASIHPPA